MTENGPQQETGITFRLEPAEVIAANDLWRRKTVKPASFVGFIAFCWVAIAVIIGASGGTTREMLIFATIVSVLGAISGVLAGKFMSRRKALSYFHKMPSSQREMTVNWSRDHLRVRTQNGVTDNPWSDFEEWAEDDTVIVFLYAGPLFMALPKRSMTTADLSDLRAQLAQASIRRAKLFPI